MELSFVKEGSRYISEFKVSSDFNLHIERDKGGYIFLYQRSSEGGEYDSVGDSNFAPQDLIIDYDCSALVYPKTIKIVSEVEPTYASLTTSGEVTEIKSQSKEIEVTSNGTTEVTPDAGFAYLNSVKVKTNVATSGGGGGSASSVEYIDVSGDFDDPSHKFLLVSKALQIRAVTESAGLYVASYSDIESNINRTNNVENVAQAISIDNSNTMVLGGYKMSLLDYFNAILPQIGLSIEWYNALPRISKEEFYNLNA